MKHILAPAQREILAQLAFSNVLLGFDFDGTLAPIVADPARAAMRATTRRLFAGLCECYPCVVISGRSLADLGPRLEGVALRAAIGNHGLEPWRASPSLRRLVARWKLSHSATVAQLPGVELEDKTFSLALHLRRSRSKKAARVALEAAIERLGPVRIVGGKQVINVLPEEAPHKGLALERERRHAGCDTAFFLGDDTTDEDVFAMSRPGFLFSVRVGAVQGSHAAYCLKSQREVDVLLKRLLDLRRDAGVLRSKAR